MTPQRSFPHGPRWLASAMVLGCLAGCETLAITAMGVGASAGVTHTAGSISSRTFTAPTPQVKAASLTALGRMGVEVESVEPTETGEVIKGRSSDRRIEVVLEPMSKTTTQLTATAKRSFFWYDAATAKEIVAQTEAALAAADKPKAPAARKVATTSGR